MGSNPTLSARNGVTAGRKITWKGRIAWPSARDWKSRRRSYRLEGSNPSPSATSVAVFPSLISATLAQTGITPCDVALYLYSAIVARRGDSARPRNTIIARFSRTTSSMSRWPTRSPSLDLGTVVSLSTINREGKRSPFRSLGSMRSLMSGASTVLEVKPQRVTDSVRSKLSS